LIRDFVISRFKLRGYLPVSIQSPHLRNAAMGISDELRIEGLLFYRIVGFDPDVLGIRE
jgi:hypothetical protein